MQRGEFVIADLLCLKEKEMRKKLVQIVRKVYEVSAEITGVSECQNIKYETLMFSNMILLA